MKKYIKITCAAMLLSAVCSIGASGIVETDTVASTRYVAQYSTQDNQTNRSRPLKSSNSLSCKCGEYNLNGTGCTYEGCAFEEKSGRPTSAESNRSLKEFDDDSDDRKVSTDELDGSCIVPGNLSSNRSSEEEKGFRLFSCYDCKVNLSWDGSKLGEKGINFRGCKIKKTFGNNETRIRRAERTSKKSKRSDGSEASARSGSPAAPDLTLASVEVAIQQQQKPKKGTLGHIKDTLFAVFSYFNRPKSPSVSSKTSETE